MLGALKPSAYLAKTKFSFRRECSMEKTEVRYWEVIADNLSAVRLELGLRVSLGFAKMIFARAHFVSVEVIYCETLLQVS